MAYYGETSDSKASREEKPMTNLFSHLRRRLSVGAIEKLPPPGGTTLFFYVNRDTPAIHNLTEKLLLITF